MLRQGRMNQGIVPRPGMLDSPAHMSRAMHEGLLASCGEEVRAK